MREQTTFVQVDKRKPEVGVPVLGYHPEWVNEDFNPTGVCECWIDEDGEWTSAQWDNDQDSYHTHSAFWCKNAETPFTPSHWMDKPKYRRTININGFWFIVIVVVLYLIVHGISLTIDL